VANDTRFKPGMSGNADAKWKLGQSGNPAGKSKRRLQFDEALQRALMVEVSPQEVARLVAEAARAGESWATRELVRRTAIVPLATTFAHGPSLPAKTQPGPPMVRPMALPASVPPPTAAGPNQPVPPPEAVQARPSLPPSMVSTSTASETAAGPNSPAAPAATPNFPLIPPRSVPTTPAKLPPSSFHLRSATDVSHQGRYLMLDEHGRRIPLVTWLDLPRKRGKSGGR